MNNKLVDKNLFSKLPEESQKIIETFDEIVQRVKPLNSKQLYRMPETIKELSHLLTDDRNSRRAGYMNDVPTLSAYIRYFMWWNLVRLSPLFAGFETNPQSKQVFQNLPENPVFLDLGDSFCILIFIKKVVQSDEVFEQLIKISEDMQELIEIGRAHV